MRSERRGQLFRRIVIIVAGLAAAACATPGPFLRSNAIPNGSTRVITTDAKLRNVYMVPPNPADGNRARWRVCAEASPDVFSALSASTAASLGGSQSPSATEANARLAHAVAEAAGTIERTQTINLLRESMYRTCERYLSGAISQEAFVVQAGRDWRAMIAILAIEQLTRTARGPATIILPASTNAVITEPTELAAELRRAATATEDARIAKENAQAAFNAAGCASVPATPPPTETPEAAAKRQQCQPLTAANTDAANNLRRAQAAQDALSNAFSRTPGAAPSEVAGTGGPPAPGPQQPGEQVRSVSDLQAIAANVQQIVGMAFSTNETELFCLQMLSATAASPAVQASASLASDQTDLQHACMQYALMRVQAAAGISPQWQEERNDEFGRLRAYLGNDPGVARTRWAQLLADAGLAQTGSPALVNAATLDEMIAALQRAFAVDRQLVIGAMEQRRRQ